MFNNVVLPGRIGGKVARDAQAHARAGFAPKAGNNFRWVRMPLAGISVALAWSSVSLADAGASERGDAGTSRDGATMVSDEHTVVSATADVLRTCSLQGENALIRSRFTLSAVGEVRSVEISTRSIGEESALSCVKSRYQEVKFSPALTPTRPLFQCGDQLMRAYAGIENEKGCVQLRAETREYTLSVIVKADGSVTASTEQRDEAFRSQLAASDKAEKCKATKEAGIAAGTYVGQASEIIKTPEGKFTSWKSLSIVVDESGCATWRGLQAASSWMRGDEKRNITHVNPTCVAEGQATIERTGKNFVLKAEVEAAGASEAPSRSEVWKCAGVGNIQVPMGTQVDRAACMRVGSAADATEEISGQIVCRVTKPFSELEERKVTFDGKGTIRVPVTLLNKATLTLKRVEASQ